MTEPLYLKDSYLREWEARVASAQRKDEKAQFIVLDNTAFYPQSGGQPHDTGTITRLSDSRAFKVVFVGKFCVSQHNGRRDVSSSEGTKISGQISHEIEAQGEGLKPGDQVKCSLDWDRRHVLMRYHTADHILTRVIINHTGARITGNQISPEKSRIDFDLEKFDREAFEQYAGEANEIIARNIPVKKYFMPYEEAMKNPDLFQLKDRLPPNIKELRIVQVGEGPAFDTSACGGCHLGSTGEIGKIKIIKMENKGKNNRRIHFVLE
jgi:misacylated tRNA(Ala) deacylase